MATAASSSMAAPAAVLNPRPTAAPFRRCAFPRLRPPPISVPSFHASFKLAEHRRSSCLQVKASSSPKDTSAVIDAEELFADLKEKWDAIENKSTVLAYGGGAIFAVWLSSTVVGAINSVPLVRILRAPLYELCVVISGHCSTCFFAYAIFFSSSPATQSDGVGGARVFRVVCVPLPSLQVKQERISRRH
ncbi:hypothetical protein DM860_004659 [Cuscuta australis]|uniref:Cyanobacterial aminoacyl-tRNA synthetase CAAD domain-containing protein n=1 Tax=Cuscuta australis TaxID=267555 RepID=A0A328EBX1_9ASTE|nr:hypothetical protein DM860_004659 [Cuscuta australis]